MAAVDWKNVGADFGRGTATMMGNALDATKGFSNYFNNLGQQIIAEEKYADDKRRRELERSQDVAFREAEAKRAGEQFNKDYILREAVAGREAEKFGREKLGDTRLQGMQSDISAGLQHGLLTQAQQKDIENRVNQFSDADIVSGRAADAMTRQFQNVLQAPKTTQQKLDLVRGYQTSGDGYDASKLLAYQQQLARPYEEQLSKEADQAFRLKLSDKEQAAANARLSRQLSAEKDKPTTLYKVDTNGNIVYTQAKNNKELAALTTKGGWNLGGNIDRAPAKKGDSLPLFGASKEAAAIDLDFFGSGDTQQARLLGQRLQNTFRLKPEQVGSVLSQSTGSTLKSGGLDTYIDPDKLAAALINAGAAATESDAKKAAKTLLASPNK